MTCLVFGQHFGERFVDAESTGDRFGGAARIASDAAALPATASIAYAGVLLSSTGDGATRSYVFVPPPSGDADAWDACLRLAQHMESLSRARDPSLP